MESTEPIIRVSQAIQFCNTLFSDLDLWVEGEIANYTVSRGMFVFFDLKDEEEEARVNCFMMLSQQTIPLEDGLRVVVRARPNIFAKSGKFSLTIKQVEAKGEGSVKRAFELLKSKLEKEGLFSVERKRLLTRFPQRIGVISSLSAAGYGDFMRVAEARLRGINYIFANVAVQGKAAESEICAAFDHLNGHYKLDAIVLIRGGGSMEDLHAFNSEPVARAIVRSKTPVLVGVGHERDVTIADFCADVRAATPSNAAQILLPTKDEVEQLIIRLTQDGRRKVENTLNLQRQTIAASLQTMQTRVQYTIQSSRRLVETSLLTMRSTLSFTVQSARQKVEAICKTVDAVSPQRTLQRGYSLSTRLDGRVIRSVKDISSGEEVSTRVSDGSFISIIS